MKRLDVKLGKERQCHIAKQLVHFVVNIWISQLESDGHLSCALSLSHTDLARVCTNKARIYSIKQGLSWFEHDL